MRFGLTVKVIIAIVAVGVAVTGAYAGYWHDQSIKEVYSSLTPQIYSLQNRVEARNAQITQLQGQVTQLNAQVSSLNSMVTSQQSDNANLKQQVAQLQQQVSDMQKTIDKLEAASVDGWFVPDSASCYYSCYVRGAYADFGTQAARNVALTLTWKNNGAFVQSNTIQLGNLAGSTVALYPSASTEQYFPIAAPANQLSWSFTWTT
jgi:TolA-binding protein